jgi:hypothetical protein
MSTLTDNINTFIGQAQLKMYEIGNDVIELKNEGEERRIVDESLFGIKELRWAVQIFKSGLSLTDSEEYQFIHYLQRKYDLNTSNPLVVGQLVNNTLSNDIQYVQGQKGDKGDAGPKSLTWMGDWSGASTYISDNVVFYHGSSYRSNTTNLNSNPESNPSDWSFLCRGVYARGAYSSGSSYYINNIVTKNNKTFIALQDNNSGSPQDPETATAYWLLIAQKGDPGNTGATGPAGTTGAKGDPGPGVNVDCDYATTANLVATYNSGAQTLTMTSVGVLTIDGGNPTAGKRVLVKDETTGTQNGIYVVTNAGGVSIQAVLTRASDFNTTQLVKSFYWVFVNSGTVNSGLRFTLVNDKSTVVLDTTNLDFESINHPMQNIGINTVYGNVSGPDPGPPQEVPIIQEWIAVPASLTDNGFRGQKSVDEMFIYFCTLTNTWATAKRTYPQLSVSASTTSLDASSEKVWVDATVGTVTINLPDAATYKDKEYTIKKIDSTTSVVNITPAGSDTIDGNSIVSLVSQYDSITIVSFGSGWYLI